MTTPRTIRIFIASFFDTRERLFPVVMDIERIGKYKVLGDVLTWATNVGYPGYANAAIDEIFGTWVINTMFAKASTGAMSPEERQQFLTQVQENGVRFLAGMFGKQVPPEVLAKIESHFGSTNPPSSS